ncbi:MAG: aldehyde dehydrogenase [Candidatus Marinimicrobia bacterium]|nr:aldehyde dehydrogenase [Candidatus Neomarinimicrobiota bacterium]
MELVQNYISGKYVSARSEDRLELFDPAIGEVYGHLMDSNSDDVRDAVMAASDAFPVWSALTLDERSGYLMSIAEEINSRLDEFSEFESRDTGKPLALARSLDIPRSISNFKFFADHAKDFKFESDINSDISTNHISRFPLGVVCCISPWNLPLYLFTWKIAPALVVGNTVVAKPSEITPYTAYLLGDVCSKIGLPPGVLNIVHGRGATTGDLLVKDENIKAISFTGGTATGKTIFKNASDSFKKLSLEMGGKNPAVIFEDCDYDKMLDTIVRSSFSNQGQICLCSSRILIERSIYERFKKDFCSQVSNLIIGDPMDIDTQFGAISSEEHFLKINNYIELARQEGASILTGGTAEKLNGRCSDGWFIKPTIIEGLDQSSRLNQEEIFGPVVTLQPFDSEYDAIEMANNTEYGLSATIWTEDLDKGRRISRNIEAGVIWINCWLLRDLRTPFGGMKSSGLGREGGDDAIKFFTEQKNICLPR